MHNLQIEFGPNLTIIFGENEAGKSTLQNFILAVLYGFRVSRRRFHQDRNRRVPWDGSPFRGSLTFLLSNGGPYELHRDFSRDQGVLYEASTGRKISDKPETWLEDKLGFNRGSFGAALVVHQAEIQKIAEKDSPTRGVLRESLERLASGLDATAASALDRLKKALGEVGERDHSAYDTPLGRARRELNGATQRSKEARQKQAELSQKMRRLREIESELGELDKRHQGLEWAYWAAKAHEIKEKIAKVSDLSRQLKECEENLKRLTPYMGFPINLEGNLGGAIGKVVEAKNHLDHLKEVEERERQGWEKARERLGEWAGVKDLGADPEALLTERERSWRDALQERRRIAESLKNKEEEVKQVHTAYQEAKSCLGSLEFVASLLPHPEKKLASTKVEWETAKKNVEKAKATCEAERERFEKVQNEAVLEEGRAKRMLTGGGISVALGIILIIAGTAVKTLFFIGGVILLTGIVLLALWRGGLSRAKAKWEVASEVERAIEQRIDGAQRTLYEVEERAKKILRDLGESEVSRQGFERAEERIVHWRDVREKLERAEVKRDKLRRDLEEAQDRLRKATEKAEEVLHILEETEVSDEAFKRARARLREWRAAMEAERTAYERYNTTSKARANAEERLNFAEAEVKAILAQAGVEDVDEFFHWAQLRKEYDHINVEAERLEELIEGVLANKSQEDWKYELAEAEKKKAAIEGLRPDLEGKPVPGDGSETIAQQLTLIRRRIEDLRVEKGNVEGALGDWPMVAEVEAEREAAAARFKRLKEYSEELQWAMEALQEAAASFGLEISARLTPRVNELAETVLGGNYEEVAVDSDLTVRVRPKGNGRWREVETLSVGAREQIFLILRVAAAEALSQAREPLPLILDEPFAQYDTSRRRSAWDFIFDLATQLQIIFFTCHENYLDEACQIASDRDWGLNRTAVGEFTIADLRPLV